jgi:hypothetical protein
VIDDPDQISPETKQEIERPKEKLEKIRERFDAMVESLQK